MTIAFEEGKGMGEQTCSHLKVRRIAPVVRCIAPVDASMGPSDGDVIFAKQPRLCPCAEYSERDTSKFAYVACKSHCRYM